MSQNLKNRVAAVVNTPTTQTELDARELAAVRGLLACRPDDQKRLLRMSGLLSTGDNQSAGGSRLMRKAIDAHFAMFEAGLCKLKAATNAPRKSR